MFTSFLFAEELRYSLNDEIQIAVIEDSQILKGAIKGIYPLNNDLYIVETDNNKICLKKGSKIYFITLHSDKSLSNSDELITYYGAYPAIIKAIQPNYVILDLNLSKESYVIMKMDLYTASYNCSWYTIKEFEDLSK